MTRAGSQSHPTIESLKERVARDPFSRAFLQLAEEYRRLGRYKEAIEVCREGLQRHPTYHTARIALGRTQMEAGQLEDARRTFAEVLDLQPENLLAGKLLAEIQRRAGDLEGAAVTYRAILRYYPDDREVAALLQETSPEAPSLMDGGQAAKSQAPPAPASTPAPKSTPPPPPGPVIATPSPSKSVPKPPVLESPIAAVEPAPQKPKMAQPADPAPDFRAEDFGGEPFAGVRETWSAPAVEAPSLWPESARDQWEGAVDDAMQTNTLAEVYLRQGLVDRAIDVFRGMLRVDPSNEKAAARLRELTPGESPAERPTELPAPRADGRDATPWSGPTVQAGTVAPDMTRETSGGARRETIRRLERWLATVSGERSKGASLR